MRCLLGPCIFLCCIIATSAHGQEAHAGVDLSATTTAEAVASNDLTESPRSGSPIILASRSVIYPIMKFSDRWSLSGAIQVESRPYFYEQLSQAGYGAKGNVLQATLNYARVSEANSIMLKLGELSSTFGSFLVRYDDTSNPLVDLPVGYGYYYAPVSLLGLSGAEVDVTHKKIDARVQLTSSSPANPQGILSHDQYANWAGGAGFTIRQGFRIGVSGYRGPYLDRHDAYFVPGEIDPKKLPAHAIGTDASWAHGQTNVSIEAMKFLSPYTKQPDLRESVAYAEVKQGLSPRWFVALRYGYLSTSVSGKEHRVETSVGFRPGRNQLIKVSYEEERYQSVDDGPDHILGIQFITSLHRSFTGR